MSRFLRWFERIAHPEQTPEDSDIPEELRRAIRAAAEAAPRLRRVPDFEARLADAATAALDYARSLADLLGEPALLDKGAWDRNPLIPIIATTPEQGLALLRNAEAVRRVFAESDAATCHFLVAMQRRESTTFGYEQHGEVLRKDVLQTAVSFENHHVIAAARTGQEVREQLVEHVLRYLAGTVPAALRLAGQSRTGLREALDLIKSQAHTLELQLGQEAPFSPERHALETTLQGYRAQAADLEQDLARLPEQPAGDGDFLNLVREVLLHPRKHLSWTRVTLRVQDFGVLVREKDSTSGRKISFLEFTPQDEPAYAVFFARLDREAVPQIWPELAPGAGGRIPRKTDA